MTTVYKGNWISAWQNNDTISIKYHPNVEESVRIGQDNIAEPAEVLFSAIEKRLWLGRDYFMPTISFCQYDGWNVKDTISLAQRGWQSQATIMRNLKLILEDLDSTANDLHLDYVVA